MDHFPPEAPPSEQQHEKAFHLPPANSKGNLPFSESLQQTEALPQKRQGSPPTKERLQSPPSAQRRKSIMDHKKESAGRGAAGATVDELAVKEQARLNKERRNKFERLMKRSVQIFNKVQEMNGVAQDEDEYDYHYQTQPARPTKGTVSPLRPSHTSPFRPQAPRDVPTSQKRATNRSSLPTHKGIYQQDSSHVISRQQKVSFIKNQSLKENKVIPKYPVEANMISNKDIYRQVALSPSRAPEIIFGNLRHNQMQFKQNLLNQQNVKNDPNMQRSLLMGTVRNVSQRVSKPWAAAGNNTAAAEAKKTQQQKKGVYLSQMSMNSDLQRNSQERMESNQFKLERNYGAVER